MHRKTQCVAWISVGFAAIGALVGVASCLFGRHPPTGFDPMSVSQPATSRSPSQSLPAATPAPTLLTLTNVPIPTNTPPTQPPKP